MHYNFVNNSLLEKINSEDFFSSQTCELENPSEFLEAWKFSLTAQMDRSAVVLLTARHAAAAAAA